MASGPACDMRIQSAAELMASTATASAEKSVSARGFCTVECDACNTLSRASVGRVDTPGPRVKALANAGRSLGVTATA